MSLRTYPDAIEWLSEHWTPREIPLRLHTIGSEGWGPFFSVPFGRYLDAKPSDLGELTESRLCHHVRNAGQNAWECPDCHGLGVYDATATRYRWPMWRAMMRLAGFDRANPPRPGLPAMCALICALVRYQFDGHAAATVLPSTTRGQWELGEPLFLLAIRRLYARYEQGPAEVGWVAKSESQQKAEGVAA